MRVGLDLACSREESAASNLEMMSDDVVNEDGTDVPGVLECSLGTKLGFEILDSEVSEEEKKWISCSASASLMTGTSGSPAHEAILL